MIKWLRVIFISSLAMNVILIVGFVMFRSSVKTTVLKLDSLNAQSEVALARYVLQELESGDPNRIKYLKQYLRESMALSAEEAQASRQAGN